MRLKIAKTILMLQEGHKTNYNDADSANGVINATSNPNMDAHAITPMTSK